MYSIGDKIAIPTCGAGVIEEIRKVEILNKINLYYVVNLYHEKMTMLILVGSEKSGNIRPVLSVCDVEKVFDVLRENASSMSKNWNRRFKENCDKIDTGDICAVAEVIRNLYKANVQKPISAGEKKLLLKAVDIVASEITLACNITFDEAKQKIYEVM